MAGRGGGGDGRGCGLEEVRALLDLFRALGNFFLGRIGKISHFSNMEESCAFLYYINIKIKEEEICRGKISLRRKPTKQNL